MSDDTLEQQASDTGRVFQQIGDTLKSARLARKLEISDVSRSLRLPGMTVEDMENGRLDRLAGLYRRGYLSNYARLLGLDPKPMLDAIKHDPAPELREVLPRPRPRKKAESYMKFATYLVATIAIVPPLVVFFVQGGLRMAEPEPSVQISQLETEAASGDEQRMARRIARALAVEESHESEVVGPVTASAMPIRSLRPVRELQPEAQATANASVPGPTTEEEPLASLELELGIELLEDSWIEIYSADGRRLEYDLMRAGQQRIYFGEPPLRLLLGRASAVRLTADGNSVEYAGDDRADVVSLELLPGGEVRR